MREILNKKLNIYNIISIWEYFPGEIDIKKLELSKSVKYKIKLISSEKKQKEHAVTSIILNKIFKSKVDLWHNSSGKPFINKSKNISISHSNNYVAIAYGKKNIGIDIERPQTRIINICKKILSKKEIDILGHYPNKINACKFWSAKEAIFKFFGEKNINFKNDIDCSDFNSSRCNKKEFKIFFEYINDYIVTYCLRKTPLNKLK